MYCVSTTCLTEGLYVEYDNRKVERIFKGENAERAFEKRKL